MHHISLFFLIIWMLVLLRLGTNLLLMRRLIVPERNADGSLPFVSVIIPALDEARSIDGTLRAWLTQNYGPFEVICVDGGSTDGTADIARMISDSRLVVIDGTRLPPRWIGKSWALEQGSRVARGELLFFADADAHYAPNTLQAAVAHLEGERNVALLGLLPYFEMGSFGENIVMPGLPMLCLTFFPTSLSNRSRVVAFALAFGAGILVRREAYERAGRHEAMKNAIIDDVGLARLFRRNGEVTEAVCADEFVSIRMYHGAREILGGFTKNAFAALNRSYILAVPFLLLIIGSSIFPYFAAVTGDAYAIATIVLISIVRFIMFANLGYRLVYALFGQPFMAAFGVVIFVRSTWKTGIRGEVEWRGVKYDAREMSNFGEDARAPKPRRLTDVEPSFLPPPHLALPSHQTDQREGWRADRLCLFGVPSGLREREEVVGAHGSSVSAGSCSIHEVYRRSRGCRIIQSKYVDAVRRTLVYGTSAEGDVGETARRIGALVVPVARGRGAGD
jgi:chlorobactene glucosyltransferase